MLKQLVGPALLVAASAVEAVLASKSFDAPWRWDSPNGEFLASFLLGVALAGFIGVALATAFQKRNLRRLSLPIAGALDTSIIGFGIFSTPTTPSAETRSRGALEKN